VEEVENEEIKLNESDVPPQVEVGVESEE